MGQLFSSITSKQDSSEFKYELHNENKNECQINSTKIVQDSEKSNNNTIQHAPDFYLNEEEFNCDICFESIAPGKGLILSMCTHEICKVCLREEANKCNDSEVLCPFFINDDAYNEMKCAQRVQHSELKAVLTEEEFNQLLKRITRATRRQLRNVFNCITADCDYFVINENGNGQFTCGICKIVNCIDCEAQHHPKSCKEYQAEQERSGSLAKRNENLKQNKMAVEQMIDDGSAMICPRCGTSIEKNGGCFFLRCQQCKLECCWGKKCARWGPKGRGDNSGGCQCRYKGNGPCVDDCPGCTIE